MEREVVLARDNWAGPDLWCVVRGSIGSGLRGCGSLRVHCVLPGFAPALHGTLRILRLRLRRGRCLRGRRGLALLAVILDPVLDRTFPGPDGGVAFSETGSRQRQQDKRGADAPQSSFPSMQAWKIMSPKDCAGSISVLFCFQLASHV